ncbi:TonB-dependent receptor [Carboxylicivirga taeanensis]|uniref:TonB-dependent receptor n=1 Tax=Carboxylicivirga taeanensis TaxID=1416875 RepID=UPI003F6E2370
MKHLLTGFALLYTFGVYSQSINIPGGQDSLRTKRHAIDEVVISAPLKIRSQQQWPGSVSFLDSVSLATANTYQLSNHLNSVPGVLMQEGTLSTNRITIRGIGSRTPYNSNRIKAYWGTLPLTDGDGVTSIEDIGLDDIYSISILKGPSSALYGAGLGGVILIDPWSKQAKKLRVGSEVGNYGTYSNQLSTSFAGQTGTSSLSANQLHTNGYRENSHYKRYNLTLKGKYQIKQHYWYYLYNYRYLKGQIPSSLDSLDFQTNPQKAADSWAAIRGYEESNRHLLNIGMISSLSNQTINTINVFGSISGLDELRPFNRLDEAKKAVGLREKLSYQRLKLRVEAGLEFMLEFNDVQLFGVKDSNQGKQLSHTHHQRYYLNFFGLTEYKIHPKLLFQAALNINTTHYQSNLETGSNEPIQHRYPLTVSPHLGINYQLHSTMYLFASAGHGFSAPSLEEAQLPNGNFNAAIKPEEGHHLDVGGRYLSANKKSSFELTAYQMWMTNLLVTKRESEEQFYGINAGRTNHRGLEASIQHMVPLSHSNRLQFSAAYTQSLNHFVDFVDDGQDYSSNHLPGIPTYHLYLSATGQMGKYNIHINYRINGKQYLNDSNPNSYAGFQVLNAKVKRSFKIASLDGEIHIGANNLLDEHYASMLLVNAPAFGRNQPRYYYPALPFNCYLGVILSL